MSVEIVKEVLLTFLYLGAELVILFLGISFFINVIQAYVPFDKLEKYMSSKNPFIGAFAGAVLGFVTPFCSCSTIPLLITMINRKVPFQTVMTYLFSSPLLDPWILALMTSIYGVKVAVIYTVVTFVFSMVIGWYLDKRNYREHVKKVMIKGNITELNGDEARRKDLVLNIKESAKETGMLVRSVLVYIIIGAFVGAIIKEAIPTDFLMAISSQNQWWVIPVAAVIGVPLYIRLSTMFPIAQALLINGFPIAPTMSLLIGGAGASLPEIIMLKGIFSNKLVGAFIVSVFLMATFSGYLFLILGI